MTAIPPIPSETLTAEVTTRIESIDARISALQGERLALEEVAGIQPPLAQSALDVFQGYIGVLVVAFIVTLLTVPIVRKLAIANGVIDHPDETRKQHRMPVAYLGGVAVLLGLLAGVLFSYLAPGLMPELLTFHEQSAANKSDGVFAHAVPLWIVAGFSVIAIVGLLDDVHGVSPRVKIGGQLFGAACLAWGQIGTDVAAGVLRPTLGAWIDNPDLTWTLATIPDSFPVLGGPLEFDLIYWTGTGLIAFFVLGACNASNLIDGLDGLLAGVTAIATIGFTLLAIHLAMIDDGWLDAPRLVLCLAVLGACLGFLPHNFNPASIFLGDCGSLLLGYCSAVMILSLGATGKTYLVAGGIIIYGIPIVDTVLAIVRRKMAGKKMSDPDSDHLHHMLKRALGVKGAVLALYAIGVSFCVLGVTLSQTKARFVYGLALLFVSYIVVYAIKIARRKQFEEEAAAIKAGVAPRATAESSDAPTERAPTVAEPGV